MKQSKLIAVSIIITIFAVSAQLTWSSAPVPSADSSAPVPSADSSAPAPEQSSPQKQFADCENNAKNANAKNACICLSKPKSTLCRNTKADELYDSCMRKSKTKKGRLDCKDIADCYRHPDKHKCHFS